MADLFKFQKTDKLPALKKGVTPLSKSSSQLLIYTKEYGYEFAHLKQYFKQHANHELPAETDDEGVVFVTHNYINIPVKDVLFWALVPKDPPLIS